MPAYLLSVVAVRTNLNRVTKAGADRVLPVNCAFSVLQTGDHFSECLFQITYTRVNRTDNDVLTCIFFLKGLCLLM